MKRNFVTFVIVGACSFAAWAEKVTETQLPPAVQQTLSQQKGADAVKDIERETRNGRTVYEVELNRTGLNPQLVIAEDGTLVRDARGPNDRNPNTAGRDIGVRPMDPIASAPPRIATMKIEDVPPAVRKTIEQSAAGRKVADIDRETWNGKTVFEVEFAQTGRNQQIFVAEDGTIVKQEGEARAEELRTPATSPATVKGPMIGTTFADTPAPVQTAIKREARGAEIADIDKERRDGRIVYEVEFKDPGRNREIHIAEDGSIAPDSRRDLRGVGAPGSTPQTRTGTTLRPGGNNLTFDQAPAAVQAAIRANGDPTTVKEIERGEKDGRMVYTVEFVKEGRNKKIQVAEDGSILKDNRE